MAKSAALIKREAAEARRRATPYRRPRRVMSQKKSATSIPFDEHAAEMIARVVGSELGELRQDLVEQMAALSARLGGWSFSLHCAGPERGDTGRLPASTR